VIAFLGLLAVILLAVADYAVGRDLGLSLFYAVPVFLVARRAGLLAGVGLALLAALAAPALRADDDDPQERTRAEVERFRERLLEANRREVEVGGLKVTVTPVPDYFGYLAAGDYLARSLHRRSADAVRERFARLAEERDEAVGVPGLLLRFVHEGARDDDFYALSGQLDDPTKQALASLQGDLGHTQDGAYTDALGHHLLRTFGA